MRTFRSSSSDGERSCGWALQHACGPADLDQPGFRLHPLKGKLAGHWSIRATASWRVVFRFENGEAVDVDLINRH